MNDKRLKQLFAAAARVEPAAGTDDLPEQVMRAVRRELPPMESSVFEQLGMLLPRVAVIAFAVLALCVLVEWTASDELSIGVAQLSEQWLFAAN
jgi:anti-sigma factor RsiW